MRAFLSIVLLFAFFLPATLLMPTTVSASDASGTSSQIADLKDQISDHAASISSLEKEIAEYQTQIDSLDKQSDTLKNKIASINTNVKKVSANIDLTQNKIQEALLNIRKLELEIQQDQSQIAANKELIAESVRKIDEQEGQSLVEIFLQNDNISDFWEKLDALAHFENGLGADIKNLQDLQSSAEEKKTLAKSEHQQLLSYQNDLSGQKDLLQDTMEQKTLLLKETDSKESQYQDLVAQKEAQKKAFEQELFDLQSKLQVALNPSSIPAAGTAPLSWPVIGPITQKFGRTVAAQRLYTSGSHSGLDIGVPVGTPVKAAANGVVRGTGNTDLTCPHASYGKWVFIEYDNGLASIYGHLSVIQATEGERVTTGQVVGLSGFTGYATGPHLHMGVFEGDAVKVSTLQSVGCPGAVYTMPIAPTAAYLDPEAYLPPDPYY